MFTDEIEKRRVSEECLKRNKHISRFHPMRWRPLWEPNKGWFPALRPAK